MSTHWWVASCFHCGAVARARAMVPEAEGPKGRAEMQWILKAEKEGLVISGYEEKKDHPAPIAVKCKHQ